MPPLAIETFPVGPLQANCHLAWDAASREAVLVDPGGEPDRLLAEAEARGLRVAAVWLTHGHVDHIAGAARVLEATGAPLWIHAIEEPWLRDPVASLAAFVEVEVPPCAATGTWRGGEEFDALGRKWRVEHTPGHSPGSVAILCPGESVGFGGDLLMEGSTGRVDLPGGDAAAMAASLRRAFSWPEDLVLHTGHGASVRIGDEKRANPVARQFLQAFPA